MPWAGIARPLFLGQLKSSYMVRGTFGRRTLNSLRLLLWVPVAMTKGKGPVNLNEYPKGGHLPWQSAQKGESC